MKSTTDNVRGSILVGLVITVLAGLVQYYAAQSWPSLSAILKREPVAATVTYAEPGGLGWVMKYTYKVDGQIYSGEANCETCYAEYQIAKATGEMTVWADPENPTNASWQKPYKVLVWSLVALYVVVMLFLIGVYVGYLNSIWNWFGRDSIIISTSDTTCPTCGSRIKANATRCLVCGTVIE